MIRFYYVIFKDEELMWHNGYTSNLVHFSIFVKDRLRFIRDVATTDFDSIATGHIDAENSAVMLTKLKKQYPESYMSGESEIYYYVMLYHDRPCCFTFNEMETADEIDGYYYDCIYGMETFTHAFHLSQLVRIYIKDQSMREFVDSVMSSIAWYTIIVMTLSEYACSTNEFTPTFIDFMNTIFPHRKNKLCNIKERVYEDFHDMIVDYYIKIIGEPEILTQKEQQELTYLYNRFLDAIDDRR